MPLPWLHMRCQVSCWEICKKWSVRSQSENENSEFPGAKGSLGWNPKQLLSRESISASDVSQVSQPYPKSIARQVQGSDLLQPCIILHKEGTVQSFIRVITKRDLSIRCTSTFWGSSCQLKLEGGRSQGSPKSTAFDGHSVVQTQDVATSRKSFQVCGSSPQWKPSLCSSVPWSAQRSKWRMLVSFLLPNVWFAFCWSG